MAYVIIALLLNSFVGAFNTTKPLSVHCISITGTESKPFEGNVSQSQCPTEYTMTSCGFRASLATETDIDGSFITQNATGHDICNAINSANSPDGVYAVARCCNITDLIECSSYTTNMSSPSNTSSCLSSNEQITGCTSRSNDGSMDGSCTGLHSQSTCCAPKAASSIALKCYQIQNESYTVQCPSDHFMSGCSALSPEQTVNVWEIEVVDGIDTCRIGTADNSTAIATAICCQIYTEAMYFDCRSQRCLYQSMICSDNRDCVVDCGYADKACQSAAIICGANATCEVLCDADESCEELRIDGTRAIELIVKCSDRFEACVSAQIACPIDGRCTIIADNINNDVLQYTRIYSVNGLNTIDLIPSVSLQSIISVYCGSNYEYACNINLTTPGNTTCESGGTIECESVLGLNPVLVTVNSVFDCRTKRCTYETLICEDNIDCSIDCGYDDGDSNNTDDEACEGAFIICPTDAKCDVLCDGNEACLNMKVFAERCTELNITCADYYESCYDASIICPYTSETQRCHITTDGNTYIDNVLESMHIYAVNGVDDIVLSNPAHSALDINIKCGVHYENVCDLDNVFDCLPIKCYSETLMCNDDNDCMIDCHGFKEACERTTIKCPKNHRCQVQCDKQCEYSTFDATESTSLDLTCGEYRQSCKNTTIYCPVGAAPEMCKITGYNDDNNEFKYMKIYAVNGLNDVNLTLPNDVNLTLQNDIKLYCGTNYDDWCNLEKTQPFKYCQTDAPGLCTFIPTVSTTQYYYNTQSSMETSVSGLLSSLVLYDLEVQEDVISSTVLNEYDDETDLKPNDNNLAIILICSVVSLLTIIGAIIWYWRQRRKGQRELLKAMQMQNNEDNQDNAIDINTGQDEVEMEIPGHRPMPSGSANSLSAEKLYEVQKSENTTTGGMTNVSRSEKTTADVITSANSLSAEKLYEVQKSENTTTRGMTTGGMTNASRSEKTTTDVITSENSLSAEILYDVQKSENTTTGGMTNALRSEKTTADAEGAIVGDTITSTHS